MDCASFRKSISCSPLISTTGINCGLDHVKYVKVLVRRSSPVRKLASTDYFTYQWRIQKVMQTRALDGHYLASYRGSLRSSFSIATHKHIATLEMIILLCTGLAIQFYDTRLITISSSSDFIAIVIHPCFNKFEYKADFVKYLYIVLSVAAIATFGYLFSYMDISCHLKLIKFTRAQVKLTWAQALVGPGVDTPLLPMDDAVFTVAEKGYARKR